MDQVSHNLLTMIVQWRFRSGTQKPHMVHEKKMLHL